MNPIALELAASSLVRFGAGGAIAMLYLRVYNYYAAQTLQKARQCD
jgi:hypothetical protein